MSTQYRCGSNERREAVRTTQRDGRFVLNGIDFVEVVSDDQRTLELHFIHNLPGSAVEPVPDEPALSFGAGNVAVSGGVRIGGIGVLGVTRTADDVLTVTVDRAGDFSPYTLRLQSASDNPDPPAGFDPQLAEVVFSFKAGCPDDFDCQPDDVCPPEHVPEPEISYLARDYAGFRRLMLDRLAVLLPAWTERHAADTGIAMVELLAYAADRLSYEQDAVATEAYLGTARRRVSVRRHARLVNYFIHDGCNARTWVQLRVMEDVASSSPAAPLLPRGSKLLTRVAGQPGRIAPGSAAAEEALRAGAEVFETMAPVERLFAEHNRLEFYTWGARECCLPRGATRATLAGHYAGLEPGEVLILQEQLGPETGQQADADPAHRHAVRLTDVLRLDRNGDTLSDPLTGQSITEITWHAEDALPFALCISSITDEQHGRLAVQNVSVALGNIVLADHGRTLDTAEPLGTVPRAVLRRIPARLPGGSVATGSAAHDGAAQLIQPRFRPSLARAPLTQAAPYPYQATEAPLGSARAAMQWSAEATLPALVELRSVLDEDTVEWAARRDLLNSGPNAPEVVVEVESDGTATLRFGDGTRGLRPAAGSVFSTRYRVGNGVRGNIGADTLGHIISDVAAIEAVTNPLPAAGGAEPESVEHVRQHAPQAFRIQQRAVTPDDYAAIAQRDGSVQRAAATVRWTGSWPTLFLTVDRFGGAAVDQPFEDRLRAFVEPFRMAGHDLEIDRPRLVALEIELLVCIEPGYFRGDVRASLLELFSNRILPDGRRGVFHPDNFSFGQAVYLSRLYAAAEAVDGVASVRVVKFQRQGQPASSAIGSGELALGRLEIAALDNDPNFPERGVFRLTVEGGA